MSNISERFGKVGTIMGLIGGLLGVLVLLIFVVSGIVIAEENQRGIIRDVLRPGRYVINPYAYRVVQYDATAIPPGYVGVLTLVSGKDPKNPNEFLVEEGERGTQKHTLGPGTYYENP